MLFRSLDSAIKFSLTDEDNITTLASFGFEAELAQKPSEMLLALRNQVEKTGDTIYEITDTSIQTDTHIPFFKLKQINIWRRELLEKHSQNRLNCHVRETRVPATNPNNYPEKNLTHTANISNTLAEKFYKKHGVTEITQSFELSNNTQNKTLMTTRYCILFEMGLCDGNGKTIKEELFLKDSSYKYALTFNCKKCEMSIKHSADRKSVV